MKFQLHERQHSIAGMNIDNGFRLPVFKSQLYHWKVCILLKLPICDSISIFVKYRLLYLCMYIYIPHFTISTSHITDDVSFYCSLPQRVVMRIKWVTISEACRTVLYEFVTIITMIIIFIIKNSPKFSYPILKNTQTEANLGQAF